MRDGARLTVLLRRLIRPPTRYQLSFNFDLGQRADLTSRPHENLSS